jgi:hypothetical protein
VRGLVVAIVLVAAAGTARADRVNDLIALVRRKPEGMERDAWKEKRREAARELGGIGDRRAVPVLIEVVEMEQFDVIGEVAIEALGKLKDARAVPALRAVIDDPSRDRYVRDAAEKALKKIGRTRTSTSTSTGTSTSTSTSTSTGTGTGTTSGSAPEPDGEPEPEPEPEKVAPAAFGDDVLGEVDRLTFALGGVRIEYDTVREQPTVDGDAALTWERRRDRERSAWRLATRAALVGGVTDYRGDGLSSRYALGVVGATGEGRLYAAARPLYGFAAAGAAGSVEYLKINRPGTDADVADAMFGLDLEAAAGGGHGRVLEVGEAIRLRRIEAVLRRARALGRPITPDLGERILAMWWTLRGEQGAHHRLTATVAMLREAGVLLDEPDASLTYQILQILLDGQLDRRPSGTDVQVGLAETYLVRDDLLPVEDGRIEHVFAVARHGSQIGNGAAEIVGQATARYRILPEDGDPTPWGALGSAAWRGYFYGAWSDPIGALEIAGEVGASTDGIEDVSEVATRVGGSVAWLWMPSRASRFRLAAEARHESGELFFGAVFDVRYGFLDATYVGSSAFP